MNNKNYLRKVYKKFSEFISEASARELEYYVLDAKYTTEFNLKLRNLVEEIKSEGKKDIEFTIIFNTENELALIDADILGKYIADSYTVFMEEQYKNASLNKIIKEVVNGNEKVQKDFAIISYIIIYRTLRGMYKDIKHKKDVVDKYKEYYSIGDYFKDNIAIIIACLLIMEDICKYLKLDDNILKECMSTTVQKKISQNE